MKACGRLNVCALLLYCGLKRTVQGKSRIAGGAVSGLRHPPTFRIGGDHVNPIQIEIIQISRSGRFPPCGAARAWLCVDMDTTYVALSIIKVSRSVLMLSILLVLLLALSSVPIQNLK